MNGNGAVAVKDKLFDVLNGPDTCLDSVERVLGILEITQGFFADCEYEYKGYEIAHRCLEILNAEDTTNWRRLERINHLKQRCWSLESTFHSMKHDRMNEQRAIYDMVQEQITGWTHPSEYAA